MKTNHTDTHDDPSQGRFSELFEESLEIDDKDHVNLQHLYVDGSKFEANANKYSLVWKKGTEKHRVQPRGSGADRDARGGYGK